MTHSGQLPTKTFFTPDWRKHLLIGAGTALLIVGFFVIAAGKGNPDWGDYWRIKPLLLSPILGGITSLCYNAAAPLRQIKGWPGKLFLGLSILGFMIGQWIGLVLGLAGTMWN
jgi:ABC-type transport system involved in cytochrome c biogenesis permease subunit